MREYVSDKDGEVWERNSDGSWTYAGPVAGVTMWWPDLEEEFGPLTYCDADGDPLSHAPADDVRALLAAAFDDLEAQMKAHPPFSMAQTPTDAIMSQAASWVRAWAAATAAGLRS